MAAGNCRLLLNNSPLSVRAFVRIDLASTSNNLTILAPRSQMRMTAVTTAKPAVLQIGEAVPMLREALQGKYDLYALGEQEDKQGFLEQKGPSIRGVVTCTEPHCAHTIVDKELVSKLPNLEIVSSFDGIDVCKAVDLHLCKKLGVHVTDTRDALPNSSAATALRLLMAISREVVDAGRYVRACRWPADGNYPITFRVMSKPKVLELNGGFPALTSGLKGSDLFDHFALWVQPDKEAFLAKQGPSFRGVVCLGFQHLPLNHTLVSKLPNLEIVAAFSAGTDNVDIPLLKSRGVRLTNVGGVQAGTVAELAVGLALATSRKIAAADRFVRDGGWANGGSFPLTRQLCNKHVGIVGLGKIGAAIARRMEAFGCTIAYWSRSPKPQYPNYVYHDNVVNLAKHCDILIGACSLTDDTKKIINREVLDALGPHGFVVNVSRGPVIDEQALVSALKEGRIAGAGLDVFENEPNVPDELMNLDTCVLQPHAGSGTHETHQAMANMVVANLEAHFSGKPLLTPVC